MADFESRRALWWLPLALLVLAVLASVGLERPPSLPAWLGGESGNQRRYRAYLKEYEVLLGRYLDIQTSHTPNCDDPAQFTPAARAQREQLREASRAEYLDWHRALRVRHGLPPGAALDEHGRWLHGLTPWD